MILRNKQNSDGKIHKNIVEESDLIHFLEGLFKDSITVWIETDMRALHNPKRMRVIEEATENLIQNILNICPKCDTPGFQVDEVEAGLPCGLCSTPTRSTLAFIYKCKACNCSERKLNPYGKVKEDPMYCDMCNP
jgi:hypothetical protein